MPSFRDPYQGNSGKGYETGGICFNTRLRYRSLLKPEHRTYERIPVRGVVANKQIFVIPREW